VNDAPMRWYEVVTTWGHVELQATSALVTWFGALVLRQDDRVVAYFRKGQFGAFWETAARAEAKEPPPESKNERPRPYVGTLTPVERPAGWMR